MTNLIDKTKKHKESLLVFFGFILSMLHPVMLLLFLISLLLYLKQKIVGSLKSLLLITTRSIISGHVAIPISEFQIVKWVLIFLFSIWIIFHFKVENRKDYKKITNFLFLLIIFSIYVIFSSFFISSFPIISIFKLLSYSIVFASVVIAVAMTFREFNWIRYFTNLLIPIFIFSFLVIPIASFRIRNGRTFQGILNHPNLFGVVSVIFITILAIDSDYSKKRIKNYSLILLSLIMIYLTESRTAMISVIVVLLIYFFTSSINKKYKILFVISIILTVCIILLLTPQIYDGVYNLIYGFIYKGNADNILSSRLGQVNNFTNKFNANRFFGAGFMTPYFPEVKSFEFSFNQLVEPGNLLFAVLGDTGIIGTVIFLIMLIFILTRMKYDKLILFIVPIIISFGEMVFFSTNSIAIFLYLFLGIYMFNDRHEEN